MRLRRLTLKNYRGFRGEKTFEFGEEFTVVAGINGRGKSAMLDGLALLLFRFLKAVSLASGTQRSLAESDITVGEVEASLEMDILCGDVPITFSLSRDPATRRPRVRGVNAAVKEHVLNIYGDPTRPDDQAPVAVYYSTDRSGCRLPRRLPQDAPSASQAAYRDALAPKPIDFRELMHRLRVWHAEEDDRPLQAMRTTIRTFLEGFGELEVETNPLRLLIRKGDDRFSISQLSDGERAFIAMLGDLVRRLTLANPELANPLEGHGVVLVDELELHLHPKWQRQIVEKLRELFPNIQLIGTTHSPFIIQSLRHGELINLDPDEFLDRYPDEYADRSIEDIAEEVQGVEVPQKSARYLNMVSEAEEFIRATRNVAQADLVEQMRQELDSLAERYSNDPAYVALLRVELESMRGRLQSEAN